MVGQREESLAKVAAQIANLSILNLYEEDLLSCQAALDLIQRSGVFV